MKNRHASLIKNFDLVRVLHALGDHQPVNAIRGEIFHVAIEETRALAVENAVAIANDRSNRGAGSRQRASSDSRWHRTKVGMRTGVRPTCLKLIRGKELAHGDFVLIGMPRPRAVHQRISFVLLVFGEGFQRARVQLRILAAGKKSGHAANSEHAVFMANLGDEVAQILEERHVVRNGVAIRKHPLRILEIEMNQAGHVVPAAKIQAHDVVAKIPGKLFHLKSERMRFDQRHALDGVRWQALEARNHLEKIAPPERLIGGFRFRDVYAERVLQSAEVRLISHHRDIKERSRKQFPGQNTSLMNVQAARPRENNRSTGVDAHRFVALVIEVREPAGERFQNIFNPLRIVLPGVGSGVFQVEHDAGSAGIQHFHDKVGVICRAGHLVPLIRAPGGKLNAPKICGGDRGGQVIGNLARVGFGQGVIAARDQRALPQRERGMQRRKEFEKARGEIASRIEFRRSGIDRHDAIRKGQGSECRIRLGGSGCHGRGQSFPVRIRTEAGR